ncbi:adult cuticle protein 1-like [Sabethes cyaneus]|uniref:adult cuticle protein 1-like n=1 Tax=Sabethes cyaneus TaxID=53552 RepID=UPI00237E77B9|nr:adult cuticle protein 1-like [Sabethes cyaneus]
MKCIVVAVILAMAVVSEAGVYPWGWPHAAALPAAVPVAAWPAAGWPYGAAPWAGAAWHGAAPWHAAAPIIAAPHGPVASVAHHAGVVPGATSVTANRGSVHVAPLPGHAVSQQQLNLAPAPGTI